MCRPATSLTGLSCRVFLTVMATEIGSPSCPKQGQAKSPMLECNRVKIFADGSLGAGTAALSEPYLDAEPPSHAAHTHAQAHAHGAEEEERGVLIHTPQKLAEAVQHAHSNGYRIEARCALAPR